MGGLNHDFLLVSAATHRPAEYSTFINSPTAVHIDDDLLRYIGDSLQWIKTINPAKNNEPGWGLNFCGPTLILHDSADVAASVFSAWADLFAHGPRELILTGAWSEIEGEPDSGHYEKLRLDRNAVVEAFRRISRECTQVAGSGGASYMLHIGI